MPAKQLKRKRMWFNDGSCVRHRPEYKDHVWSYDFVMSIRWRKEYKRFNRIVLLDTCLLLQRRL